MTCIAIVNLVLVISALARHRDSWVRLPLLTILIAVVTIWVGSAHLQKGMGEVSLVDEKTGLRLANIAFTIALMANLAILSAVPLLH